MKVNGVDFAEYFNQYPDENGYFGKYGGVYVDEKLKAAMEEITEIFLLCHLSVEKIYCGASPDQNRISGTADTCFASGKAFRCASGARCSFM